MKEQLDLVKILKDCPKGMPLDCAMFDGSVTFNGIVDDDIYPIEIKIDNGYEERLNKYGGYNNSLYCKCVIFPKGKTSWEGFQRPFVDGDILFYKHKSCNVNYTFIYKYRIDMHYLLQYCGWFSEKPYLGEQFNVKERMPLYENDNIRFATEEEKKELFTAIKENGYEWNLETKTLEKLIVPEFKVGDKVVKKG